MPRGNPSPKLAITVDPDVYEQLVVAAHAQDLSVSAWMTNAARTALGIQRGLEAVAEWEADNGALSDEEMAVANRRIDLLQLGQRSR